MSRLWLPITVMLLTADLAARYQPSSPDPSADIQRLAGELRRTYDLPGIAVITARSDGAPRIYVDGRRRIDRDDPLASGDRMHLGSLTKGITATVIGALTEQGRMSPDTTIAEAFPELVAGMQPAYRAVSARQLLAQAGGVQPYHTKESLFWAAALAGTAAEQQAAFVTRVLGDPPSYAPGTRHEYSNAGASIAGAMAVRRGNAPYRRLVEQLVFAPLGAEAAFGNPGLAAAPQPWGHVRSRPGPVNEVSPEHPFFVTPVAIEAAGDASPAMPAYGRFLQLHLRGLRGRDDVLKATTIRELHRLVPPINPALGFGMGWVVATRDGSVSHEHGGSYGAYVAHATIHPSRDAAVAVLTNVGGDQVLKDAVAELAGAIIARVSATDHAR